jgi:hypothetical protein
MWSSHRCPGRPRIDIRQILAQPSRGRPSLMATGRLGLATAASGPATPWTGGPAGADCRGNLRRGARALLREKYRFLESRADLNLKGQGLL